MLVIADFITMQLKSGFCEICKTLLIPQSVTKLSHVVGFHRTKVCSKGES